MREKDRAEKRELARRRASELKAAIGDYLEARGLIPDGMACWDEIKKRQEKIKKYFHAGDKEWYDWQWQVKSRIESVETLAELLDLPDNKVRKSKSGGNLSLCGVTVFLSDIAGDMTDPIFLQAVPRQEELADSEGVEDPWRRSILRRLSPLSGATRTDWLSMLPTSAPHTAGIASAAAILARLTVPQAGRTSGKPSIMLRRTRKSAMSCSPAAMLLCWTMN